VDPIEDYFNLRQRIDTEAKRLVELHNTDIACRPGCDSCCLNLTVFPVEFFAMQGEMKQAGLDPKSLIFAESSLCGFLHNGLCRIYPFRPIICRTHGLPILFINDTSGESAWDVSFCRLNFSKQDHIEFTDDMLLDIEEINAEMNRINHGFITSTPQRRYRSRIRIPLKLLCTTKR